MPSHTNQIVLGAGQLFFDPFDANGAKTGERYYGDTPGFSINVTSEKVEVFNSDTAIAELLANIATKVTRTATILAQDISVANLTTFALATLDSAAQSSSSVTDHPIAGVLQGRWYQIGVSSTFPTGARALSAVVVTNDAGTPVVYDLTTDYELDLDLGRIYIVVGGDIVDGTNLEIDYTKAAVAWDRISTGEALSARGALRYIADNTRGPNRDVYAPQVELRPNGDVAFKSRDTIQQLSFEASFEKPATGSALYIEGRPVA